MAAEAAAGMPLPAVQAALRKTTELLAHELARPGAQAPDWTESEWRVARAVVAIHGVSGLLAGTLRWQGPAGWRLFLEEQRAQIAQRLPRIQALLRELDSRARACGLALVALKGAALHAQGVYAAGERPMADVDLLVAEADAARAAQLITELGFTAGLVNWKHRTFELPGSAELATTLGEHSSNALKIELHSRIHELLPLRPVDISSLVLPRDARAGLNAYPSRAALLLHLLLHAAGAMMGRSLRLLNLHDLALLTRDMTPADWDDLLAQGATTADGSLWWAFPPLTLVHRYYRCVPEAVLARTARGCRWPLRSAARRRLLSDVSLSYLWISAFPGIEWSRSWRELTAYAAVRVRPRTETLALREAFARSQPLVNGGEWAATSQGRRIARWLLARQPRQESLQPVRASLVRPTDPAA